MWSVKVDLILCWAYGPEKVTQIEIIQIAHKIPI